MTPEPHAVTMPERRLLPVPPPDEALLPAFPGHFLEVGPRRVFVRRTPDGVTAPGPRGVEETAVYVHGLGGASTNWTDLMHALSRRLRGVAVDLPGFGHSEPPPDGRYALAAHAAAVVDLVEVTAGGPVHLFGNSLGGAVATLVAAQRPDLVRTLTLVAPALPFFRPLPGHGYLAAGLVPPVRRWLDRAAEQGTGTAAEQYAEMLGRLVYGDPSRFPAERKAEAAAEFERRAALPYVRDAFTGSFLGLINRFAPGPGGLWRAAHGVTAPTLAVLGARDQLVDVRIAGRLARAFADSRIVVESGLGHVPQMERPEAVAALVADRLDEVAARPA